MRNERGVALLIALILTVLLSLIGLSLILSTMTSLSLGTEFENHERAILIADGGLNEARANLRASTVNDILASTTQVPAFAAYSAPQGGTYQLRNPITLIEARNTNFAAPDFQNNVLLSVKGLLTQPAGTLLAGGPGRYFARLVDNADEAKFGAADDPTVDSDGIVLMRVIGVFPTLGDRVTHSTAFKNSVAVLEAAMKADMSLAIESPIVLCGPTVTGFDPNAEKLLIDGYDHTGMSYAQITMNNLNANGNNDKRKLHDEPDDAHYGIGLVNNDPGAEDAKLALQQMLAKVDEGKGDYITGLGGTPSIGDVTQVVRDSENEDAANIFNPYFMNWFMAVARAQADESMSYYDDTDVKRKLNNVNFGTTNDPQMVFVDGDVRLSGNLTGAGLLIVTGSLFVSGKIDYEGMILVVGEDRDGIKGGEVTVTGNMTVIGGLFAAKLVKTTNTDGSLASIRYGSPSFTIGGTANIYNHSGNIDMGLKTLPLRIIGWREVTPEIESAGTL